MSDWVQSYGALAAALVAASLALWGVALQLRARRRDWLRDKQLPVYAEFMRLARELRPDRNFDLTNRLGDNAKAQAEQFEVGDDASLLHHLLKSALAEELLDLNLLFAQVELIGTREVSNAAQEVVSSTEAQLLRFVVARACYVIGRSDFGLSTRLKDEHMGSQGDVSVDTLRETVARAMAAFVLTARRSLDVGD